MGFALGIGNMTGVSYAAQTQYETETGIQLGANLPSDSMFQTTFQTESYEEDGTQSDSADETPTNTDDATDPTASTEIKYVLSILYESDNYVKAGKSVSLDELLQYFDIDSATVAVDTYDTTNLQYSNGMITFVGTVGAEVNYDIILKGTGSDSTKSYNFKISCTTTESEILTDDSVVITTKETTFTYSGSAITPEVTVKYNGNELKGATDYAVTYTNNINAGTGIIYVKGLPATSVDKKGYIGTVSKTFTINKADFKPTVNELTYNTTDQDLVSIDAKYKDSVKFKLETDADYSSTIPKGKNAGTYKVYYKVTGALDDNYNNPSSSSSTENYVSVKISPVKATLKITGKSETKSYTGSELSVVGYSKLSIDCEEFNKAGYKTGYTTSDFKYYSENIESQPTAKGTAVGVYYMGLAAEDFKNTNTNFDVTFVIVKDGALTISDSKGIMTVSSSPVSKVYDGNSHNITVSAKDSSGNNVSTKTVYRLSTSTNYSENHPVCKDVGTYNIVYKVTADGYDDVYGSQTVTITPKSVSLTWPNSYSSSAITPSVSGTVNGDSVSARSYVISSDTSGVTFSGELTGTSCKNYIIGTNKTHSYTVKSNTSTNTTSGTNTTTKTSTTGAANTTSSKSTTPSGTTSSSSSKTAGSTGSSTSSSTSSGSKSSGSTGSSLSDLDTTSDSDTGSSSSTSLPGTGLMTMDELNAAADDIANGGTGKSTSDLSSLLAENAVDEADLYEDDEDYYYDDDDYYEDDYYVDYDIYDSDGMMTYGRMVHLADPERYPVILAITLSILILCLAAGIVFLILSIRKKSSDTH